MRKDTPTYDELQQDAASHWRDVARVRDAQHVHRQDLLKHPWRCPSCGNGGLTDPICPKCRSARVVELE